MIDNWSRCSVLLWGNDFTMKHQRRFYIFPSLMLAHVNTVNTVEFKNSRECYGHYLLLDALTPGPLFAQKCGVCLALGERRLHMINFPKS